MSGSTARRIHRRVDAELKKYQQALAALHQEDLRDFTVSADLNRPAMQTARQKPKRTPKPE